MPLHIDKIKEVLEKFEGKPQTTGYIPCYIINSKKTINYKGIGDPSKYDPMGISGVTIGIGVDLGQTDEITLKKINVPDDIIIYLKYYLGKKDKEAVYTLHEKPLQLDKKDVDILDNCMHLYHINMISKRYDKDAGENKFINLPWQAQAVIVSILYQRGINSPKKFPNTWNALINQDWKKASQLFQNPSLWNNYQNRRKEEGKILEQLV